MKRQIRREVFETNSSSVHSLTMCTKSDYDKWVNGEYVYDRCEEKLIPVTEEIQKSIDSGDYEYLTSEKFDEVFEDYDYFEESFTTPSNEQIIAFGYSGYDN